MTLPTSPPLALTQVLAEFGAPAGTPLSAMVRGGAYVPNIPQNSNVPTAPPIELLDFLGAANTPPVRIENHDIYSWSTTNAALAGYRLGADGVAYFHRQGGYSAYANEWLVAGAAGDYEVRATLLAGDTPSGSFNAWLSLDQDREWQVAAAMVGSLRSAHLLIEIRSKVTQAVLDSAEIIITAEREYNEGNL